MVSTKMCCSTTTLGFIAATTSSSCFYVAAFGGGRDWLVLLMAPMPAALQHHGSTLLSSLQPYKLLADLQCGTGIMRCEKKKKNYELLLKKTMHIICFLFELYIRKVTFVL